MNDGSGIYGCIRCDFGYYGIVEVKNINDEVGYIKQCVDINKSTKPTHGLNKNCNSDVFY